MNTIIKVFINILYVQKPIFKLELKTPHDRAQASHTSLDTSQLMQKR